MEMTWLAVTKATNRNIAIVNQVNTRLSTIEQDVAQHELIMEQLPSQIIAEVTVDRSSSISATSVVICERQLLHNQLVLSFAQILNTLKPKPCSILLSLVPIKFTIAVLLSCADVQQLSS